MQAQEFYATHGAVSDPGNYRRLYTDLPDDVPSLCKVLQGTILHFAWAERYGVKLSGDVFRDHRLRRVSRQLARMMELDPRPLTAARAPENRLVGNCRDYSLHLAAILRHKGIPARARCGFATYFMPNRYEDHWVCQYWSSEQKRWAMVDAQLDQLQRDAIYLRFDTLDIPEGLFLPAGDCWNMCRAGKADPGQFGFGDMLGMWYVGGNLIRDLLSLNKIELTYADEWGLMPRFRQTEFSPEYLEKMDRIAAATRGSDPPLAPVQALCRTEELAAPPGWEP